MAIEQVNRADRHGCDGAWGKELASQLANSSKESGSSRVSCDLAVIEKRIFHKTPVVPQQRERIRPDEITRVLESPHQRNFE
jgi:hypothetical protein